MGPKLEKGVAAWLWVGGEEGRLLGLEECGDWLAGVDWSVVQNNQQHEMAVHSQESPSMFFYSSPKSKQICIYM